jgi:hypothetical protein
VDVVFRSVGGNDGWVRESSETSGVGGTLNASATNCRVGDDARDRQYRGILDFNTRSLPSNTVITSAVLEIRLAAIVGGDPFATHGNLTIDIRVGGFHSNLALETLDFQAAASRGSVGAFGPAPDGGWYRATLSAPAYSRVNLSGHTQVRLRFARGDNDDNIAQYLAFRCGDAGVSSRPRLLIRYYVPGVGAGADHPVARSTQTKVTLCPCSGCRRPRTRPQGAALLEGRPRCSSRRRC